MISSILNVVFQVMNQRKKEEKTNNVKTKELEKLLGIELFTDNTRCICERFQGAGYSEMDVCKLTNTDYIYEYELKVSRSDFLKESKNFNENKDRQKFMKHKFMQQIYEVKKFKTRSRKTYKIPNKYYFVCPKDLIKLEEILPYQGLIYIDDENNFEVIREAKFLHKDKVDNKTVFRMLKTLSERSVFDGVSKITYEIKKGKY
jgi:hypothetical protein